MEEVKKKEAGRKPDLSVILVNWNTKELILYCLASIFSCTRGVAFEVIVVDNASEDGSAEAVENDFPGVKLIKNKKNMGFSAGCNAGFEVASGRNLLFLNSDTYAREDSLSTMSETLDRLADVGSLICTMRYPDGDIHYAFGKDPSLTGMLFNFFEIIGLKIVRPLFKAYDMSTWEFQGSTYLPEDKWVGGVCMMVKREVFERAGRFDENYGLAYLEDADLGVRIRRLGFKFYYLSDCTVYHLHGHTIKKTDTDFKDFLKKNLQKNQIYFFKKNYGPFYSSALRALLAVQNLIFLAYLIGTYFFKSEDRKSQKKKIRLYLELVYICFTPLSILNRNFKITS